MLFVSYVILSEAKNLIKILHCVQDDKGFRMTNSSDTD